MQYDGSLFITKPSARLGFYELGLRASALKSYSPSATTASEVLELYGDAGLSVSSESPTK